MVIIVGMARLAYNGGHSLRIEGFLAVKFTHE